MAMDIGGAVKALREGKCTDRAGWNGKGMWLYLVDAVYEDNTEFLPYIRMVTVTGAVVPWLASQTDILATDWEVV